MRILLVEDDNMIGEVVQQSLRDATYAVDWVKNGQTALNVISTQYYDLILLDLGLPGKDGLDVLDCIRNHINPVPVIIMTARDSLESKIRGLDSGADDYVLKPFEMSELLARIRVVLRRKSSHMTSVLSNDTISLDTVTHEVYIQGNLIKLSSREFSTLQALMIKPGAILSRKDLEDRVYGWEQEVESNAIEFLIHGLRKKLGNDTIKNVRGAGWKVSKKT